MLKLKQIAFLLFLLFFISCQTFAQSLENRKKLPTVNVIAESEKPDSGYFTSKSNSATKINMPLLDTPQAISVVSATQHILPSAINYISKCFYFFFTFT